MKNASRIPSFSRRDFFVGAAAAATAFGGLSLLGGCGLLLPRPDASEEEDSVATLGKNGGTLIVASHWPYSFDPFYLQELAGAQIAQCLLDPLVRYDYQAQKLVPAAAESWQVNEEGTVFTFNLAPHARFHNGEPVTAADFKFSWERLLKPDPDGAFSDNAPLLSMVQGANELREGEAEEAVGIRVVDETTLEVTLTGAFHEFPYVLTYPAFAPLCAKSMGSDFFAFAREPLGSGPFKMAFDLEQMVDILRLARFNDYQGTPALLEAVEFWFFSSDMKLPESTSNDGEEEATLWEAAYRPGRRNGPAVTGSSPASSFTLAGGAVSPRKVDDKSFRTYEEKAYERFLSGEVDVAPVPVWELEDARARFGESQDGYTAAPGAQTLTGGEACTQFLVLNLVAEPLSNPKVREALSYAIDREALCEKLFLSANLPATGIIPPGVEGFRDGAWPAATYDLAKARQILSDAGYPEGKELAPLTLVVWDIESERALFKRIAADLRAAGFVVRVKTVLSDEEYQEALKENAGIATSGWIADFPLMENILNPLFASSGSFNQFEYSRAEVDEGITAARAIAGERERTQAFQAVDDLIAADMPVVPLYYTRLALVCSDRTNDFTAAPDGTTNLTKPWLSW
ncbi:MAG: ABC transporter substrate-binding protein [Coriobacteriales bacterium]|jgi:ABC-type transport system substrate-binding protein|nr:ABC transporter substrate-binding protein [Coriobacteriales bacterium]